MCSAHLKGKADFTHKLIQYGGRLHVSTITLAELLVWVHRPGYPRRQEAIFEFLSTLEILPFDRSCADQFGRTRALMMEKGLAAPAVDFMIAATALAHDLTLVTHNTKDFANIPGLRVEDWIAS
jgi:tRNA(fMet)-specific endonuclease VapC